MEQCRFWTGRLKCSTDFENCLQWLHVKNELFQIYEGFFVLCYLEVCQLPSFCFIKSVASRLDAEFVKTTIEMEKICGMLNWKYLFLTDQTRFCLDTDKWCGFEAEVEIISGLRPEHVSAETKFQGFLRHGILGEVCYRHFGFWEWRCEHGRRRGDWEGWTCSSVSRRAAVESFESCESYESCDCYDSFEIYQAVNALKALNALQAMKVL